MDRVSPLKHMIGVYLGQDWDLFGETPSDAVAAFCRDSSSARVAEAAVGLEELIASATDEQAFELRWVYEFSGGAGPEDGESWREFLARILEVLRAGRPG